MTESFKSSNGNVDTDPGRLSSTAAARLGSGEVCG